MLDLSVPGLLSLAHPEWTEVRLQHEPVPRVILWSERRLPIVVSGLSSEGEAFELLEKLQASLDQQRRYGTA